MSNLYKQRFVTEKDGAAPRVINSNDLIRQKLEEQARALLKKEEDSDGFRAGIAGTDGGVEPREGEESAGGGVDPEEYVNAAREQAQQLLAEARIRADQLIAEAQSQIARDRETAAAEGRENGYAQGMEEAERHLATEKDRLEQQERAMWEELQRQKEELEPQLVQVVTELVEQVFHIQFHDKEEILLYLVRNTLESVDGGRNFIIKAGMERARYLEEHRQEILDCLGRGVTLDIIGEHSMGEGDCIIETDHGLFECGPDVQLENLMKDIRSLCLRG